MSLESGVLEQAMCDIKITRARYAELLIAEHDCNCLKDLILQKVEEYSGLSNSDLILLKQLYFEKETIESEVTKNA